MGNKIEKVVRFYMKRYLTEVANDLETLVERKVRARLDLVTLLKEEKQEMAPFPAVMQEGSVIQEAKAPPRKKITPADLGVTDEVWKGVYADTLSSGNPILNTVGDEDQPDAEHPEYVSEAVMVESGLMKDYSKHMDAFEKKDLIRTGDSELEARRRELLAKHNFG